MRAKLGLLVIALSLLFAGGASAHRHVAKAPDVVPVATAAEVALADAVFAAQPPAATSAAATPGQPGDRWSLESAPGQTTDKPARVLIRQQGGAIETTRFTFDGAPLVPEIGHAVPLANPSVEPRRVVDVSYTRAWPAVVKIPAGPYALAITPHAGVGFGDYGQSAEAGATVSLKSGAGPLDRLSARHGEWYLFASASGRSVGLNMIDPDGAPSRLPTAWYAEGVTARVNSVHAGLGWRRGRLDAMLGYVGWQVRSDVDNGPASAAPRYRDSLVGLSINIRL